MFKAPFSFNGRIRRTEYGLSCIILWGISTIFNLFIMFMTMGNTELYLIILLISYIPMFWFSWAQGAKRCHDLGNSGWYQLIPFYVLWMLFQDGEAGENQYGLNPKGVGNETSYDDQINEIGKSLDS
ncbi:DUF805 domain-containing protein [Emticicia agri]|uniref:DUF805 domain-containing protein n=2 Tax=Emticicia agri TaxID=2492393 RepID=A0A4Q5M3H9_9BACT|nr:DUF805 domain-containing protein [Emticicia agri]